MYEKIENDKYYHIFNQAKGVVTIFKAPRNYLFFINKLEKHKTPVCELIVYCLIKNHFHLVVKTKDINDSKISRAFVNKFIVYAKAFTKTYERSASLFKKPFKRKIIASESYLKNVLLYVHCNAIKDGFVEDPVSYPWSSYLELLDETKIFLARGLVAELFDNKSNFQAARKHYLTHIDFIPTFDNN